MGIISAIKKKLKDVQEKKAIAKGGQTPLQKVAIPAVQKAVAAITQPVKQAISAVGQKITDVKAQKAEAKGGVAPINNPEAVGGLIKGAEAFATGKGTPFENVQQGTVPIGAVGVASTAKGIISTSRNLLAKAGLEGQKASVARIATTFGKSEVSVQRAVEAMKYRGEVVKAVKGINIVKMALGAGGTIVGADILTDWYALDNVIGGQKFYVKDLAAGAADGSINALDAQKKMQESMEVRQIAINKVKLSTSLNPLLWPFRKLMLTGMEADNEAIQVYEDAINQAALKASASGAVASPAKPEHVQAIDEWKAARDEERAKEDMQNKENQESWKEAKDDERKAEAEYYADQIKKAAERKAQQRIEDDKYWAKVKKEAEDRTPSKLTFGLL